jgi:hypothetical protein
VSIKLRVAIIISFWIVGSISNYVYAQNANPKDVQQAQKFLSDLPPACKNSWSSVSRDGTVVIRIICEKSDKSLDGSVEIKDGIVKKIR